MVTVEAQAALVWVTSFSPRVGVGVVTTGAANATDLKEYFILAADRSVLEMIGS
jgi:hypothetical protein